MCQQAIGDGQSTWVPSLGSSAAHACDILQRMQRLQLRAAAPDVIGKDRLQQESADAVPEAEGAGSVRVMQMASLLHV